MLVFVYFLFSRPNLTQDGAQGIFAGVGSCERVHMSVCNLGLTSAAAAFHSISSSDVYTRSNGESIWWTRCRVFEECQRASGCTHSHSDSDTYTNIFTNKHLFLTLTECLSDTQTLAIQMHKHSSAVTAAADRGCCRTVEAL